MVGVDQSSGQVSDSVDLKAPVVGSPNRSAIADAILQSASLHGSNEASEDPARQTSKYFSGKKKSPQKNSKNFKVTKINVNVGRRQSVKGDGQSFDLI